MSTVDALLPAAEVSIPPAAPSLPAVYGAVLRSWRGLVPIMFGQAAAVVVVLILGWLLFSDGRTINGLPVVRDTMLPVLILVTSVATLFHGAGTVLASLRGQPVQLALLRVTVTSTVLLSLFAGLVFLSLAGLWPRWVTLVLAPGLVVVFHLICWLSLVEGDEDRRGLAGLRRLGALAWAAGWRTWGLVLVGTVVLPGSLLAAGGALFWLVNREAITGTRWLAVLLMMLALLAVLMVVALTVLLVGAASAVGYQRAVLRSAIRVADPDDPAALGGALAAAASPAPATAKSRAGRWSPVIIVVLLVAGVAAVVVNPRGAPEINLVSLPDPVLAVGLPAGQPPVLATRDAVLDCQDSACTSYQEHLLRPDPTRAMIVAVDAAVAGDGSVFFLLHDQGDQQLRLARCSRAGECQDGAMVGDLSTSPSAVFAGAIGLSPSAQNADGPIGVVTALGADEDYRISVLSCTDIRCDGAVPRDFGGIGRIEGAGADVLRVLVDAQGLPTVGYRTSNHDVFVGTCESAACASPRLTQINTGSPDMVDTDRAVGLTLSGGTPIVYDQAGVTEVGLAGPPRLLRCADVRCAGSQALPLDTRAGWIGPALAVTGQTVHTAVLETGRLVSYGCVDGTCEATPLIDLASASYARLAVAPDGRLALTYRTGDGQAWLLSYA